LPSNRLVTRSSSTTVDGATAGDVAAMAIIRLCDTSPAHA
jgi:hypothetical protein